MKRHAWYNNYTALPGMWNNNQRSYYLQNWEKSKLRQIFHDSRHQCEKTVNWLALNWILFDNYRTCFHCRMKIMLSNIVMKYFLFVLFVERMNCKFILSTQVLPNYYSRNKTYNQFENLISTFNIFEIHYWNKFT